VISRTSSSWAQRGYLAWRRSTRRSASRCPRFFRAAFFSVACRRAFRAQRLALGARDGARDGVMIGAGVLQVVAQSALRAIGFTTRRSGFQGRTSARFAEGESSPMTFASASTSVDLVLPRRRFLSMLGRGGARAEFSWASRSASYLPQGIFVRDGDFSQRSASPRFVHSRCQGRGRRARGRPGRNWALAASRSFSRSRASVALIASVSR